MRGPSRAGYRATRMAAGLAACLLVVSLAACGASFAPTASRGAVESVLAAVPTPPGSVLTVGANGPGVDGDARFVAYESNAAPPAAASAFRTALVAAGYTDTGQTGSWQAYLRSGATIWVSVSASGPPTTIIVQTGAAPAAISWASAVPSEQASELLIPEPPVRPGASSHPSPSPSPKPSS